MLTMSSTEELNKRLSELDAEFDREMRTRGFDPAQADNVALPSHLAALYAEREKIKAQIEESEGKTDDSDRTNSGSTQTSL
jgi:cytidylate kinase